MSSDGALANNEAITTSQEVQLLCTPSYRWSTSGETADCVQSSDASNVQQLTYVEIIEDGWIIESAVPRSSGPTGAYIFVKLQNMPPGC